MFISRKGLQEMIANTLKCITPEDIGLVKCEHTKLYGKKSDMVVKKLRCNYFSYWAQSFVDDEIYYSPMFAPKWDVKDITEEKIKYFKIVGPKEVEVKIK